MQQERLIEQVIEILTSVKVSFHTQDVTPEQSVEREHPERQLVHGISFPKHPEVAKNWARYLKRKGLSFGSFWQCAIAFAKYYRVHGGL